MRDYATKYDRVMLLTDLTEKSHAALGYARAIAEYYNSHLIILHVRPAEKPVPSTDGFSATHDHGIAVVRDQLEAIGRSLRADGLSVQVRLCRGTVARQTILRNIRATKPDLIVQGTGGITDLRRAVVGSIAEGVLRSIETPILTVPAGLKLSQFTFASVSTHPAGDGFRYELSFHGRLRAFLGAGVQCARVSVPCSCARWQEQKQRGGD